MVSPHTLGQFSNADPTYYENTTQIVPNSEIPDEHWHPVSRETDDPWSQYKVLKEWSDQDREFVRNVLLEEQTAQPTWRPVQDHNEEQK